MSRPSSSLVFFLGGRIIIRRWRWWWFRSAAIRASRALAAMTAARLAAVPLLLVGESDGVSVPVEEGNDADEEDAEDDTDDDASSDVGILGSIV